MVCEGWEGNTVAGKFPLLEWLGGWADRCVFLTVGQGIHKANIKLIVASGSQAEAHLANWESAKALSHPALLQLMDSGRSTIQGSEVVYLLTERTDAFLSGVIPRKALGASDVKAIFDPIVDALSFLHEKGLAHGSVKPSNIVQVGEHWKLAPDEMAGSGGLPRSERKLDGYDAPETAAGNFTPAADLWSLGIIAVEAFSQRTPTWDREAKANLGVPEWVMPEPFREMARGCLRWEPSERISIKEAKALLARYTAPPGAPAPAPAAIVAEPAAHETISPEPPPAGKKTETIAAEPPPSFREPEPAEFTPRSRMFSNLEDDSDHASRKGPIAAVILVLLAIGGVLAIRGFRGKWFSPGETLKAPAASQSAPPGTAAPSIPSSSSQPVPANPSPSEAASPAQPGSTESQSAPSDTAKAESQHPTPEITPAPAKQEAPAEENALPPNTKTSAVGARAGEKAIERAPEANSKGAVVKRVLPNVETGASESMQRATEVELRVSVNEEGTVSNVEYTTRGPGNYFARKAHQAVEEWKFKPPQEDGHAVSSEWVVLFRFERHKTDVTATEIR